MSMSTHLIGIIPPNDMWKNMKAIWDSCEVANIKIPSEVLAFFDDTPPDDAGVMIDLETIAKPYHTDSAEGFELDVDKIPKHVKTIRFYNSW